MERPLVKIKVPLPLDDASGFDAEWLWALPTADDSIFVLDNVPIFANGISCGDSVKVGLRDETFVFEEVVRRSGHSTYRIYAKSDRKDAVISTLVR